MSLSSIVLLVALPLGYALGSIPFGLLLTKRAGLGDVRNIGSGNIGATNVLRTGSKRLAAATLLLDLLKATVAVILVTLLASHIFLLPPTSAYAAGIYAGVAAFIGHLFPVWLNFKGGKGVATYIGVLLGAAPSLAAGFCLTWLLVAVATRYSSLAALVASVTTPFIALSFYGQGVLFFCLFTMTILLVWKHRENISRLLRREESKIGQHT